MSQSSQSESMASWLKRIADRFAVNLREAGFTKEAATAMVTSPADPVGAPDPAPVSLTTPVVQSLIPEGFREIRPPVESHQAFDPAFDLDRVTQLCKHPGIAIHRFLDGETTYCCQVCAKTWPTLQAGIDEAEQTRPINMTEGTNDPISPVVAELASELSARMGATISALVEATNAGTVLRQPLVMQPGTMSASFTLPDYQDFVSMGDLGGGAYYDRNLRTRLRAQTPFSPRDVNQPVQDPAMMNANQKLRQAEREAEEKMRAGMNRRKKAMEDAARAAAAAFDMDENGASEPVKLDNERRLKVVS